MTTAGRTRRPERATAIVRVRPARAALPAPVEAVLAAPGEPLDVALRGEMERRFGHDFGDVRVHADEPAAAAARLLGADAFTSGPDVVFAAGRYRPQSEEGRRLIAHELAHTLQQGHAAATALQASTPDAAVLEREASSAAARVIAGETLPPGAVTLAAPAARGRIARQASAALEHLPADVPDSPEAVRALAGDIARLLAFDPSDTAGRVVRRLARFAPVTREAVATELAGRIPATTATELRRILTALLPPGTSPVAAVPAHAEPLPEGDTAEPAGAAFEPAGEGPEPAAAETARGPAETAPGAAGAESAEPAEPDEVPEPLAVPEGPVAEPTLEGDAAQQAPESEAAEVPAAERAAGEARAETVAAIPATEAAGPEEEAADPAPAEDTEAEVLESQDEDDAEPPGPEDEARVDAAEAAVAEPAPPPGEDEASDVTAEAEAEEGGDPTEPVADAEEPTAPAAEAEADPDETESVAEQPPEAAGEAGEEPEPAADVVDGAEPEAPSMPSPAGEAGESDEAEPDEAADSALAEDGPAAEDEGPAAAGADEVAAPIEDPEEPEAPDLSAADPAEAMEAAGSLPPARSEVALTGVDAAASRSVATERAALADTPPALERPTGAPSAAELQAEAAASEAPVAPARLQRAPTPPAAAGTRVEPLPPAPPPVAARARAPQITAGTQGELGEDGRRALQASLRALPVRDPALDIGPGPAPSVALDGGADPQLAHAERGKLESAARGALVDGRRELAKPAGEQHLVPRVPAERLTATIPATPAPAAPAGPPTAAAGATLARDPASVLAREKRGAELRAAARDAAAGMRSRRAEQAATAQEERRRSQEQVTQAVRDSAAQQAAARGDARGEVHTQRKAWSTAEHELAEGELRTADTRLATAVEDVATLKTDADAKAAAHVETGEREAETARREGERQAEAERKRGEEKTSDGVLGWLADQATALFDEIKAGITKAFEVARAAVRLAIDNAKKLAAAAIDFARTAIVSAIRLAGDALIAIGDRLLAGFPGVRDRFRRAIEERVARAQKAIDALADGLKSAVLKALDLLGAALDAALGLLEKGLLAMVDAYRAAVAGALRWAQSVVDAFAAFAALMKDIAANPRQWLANLAASAKDGVRNHLWKAFKAAIKQWFADKVEEVLGLGLTIWNVLKKGGLSLSRIGSMAWEAIKAAIPPALIQILIEKLISLLIPAAAAVMLIIETLQAAWGTIQRVLEAFERFFAFLRAVRTGNAGPHFARAIAAAAIAVIDFAANWLLKRLRKPAGKIAKKLKALAAKLGKKLARAGKKLFKKRRKKPKLKGKPKKKPKPDKKAQAEKRVGAATDFIGRQLDRGMWEPILWGQMQLARVRWRVRISFRSGREAGTLTVSVNPTKKTKTKKKKPKVRVDYVAKVESFQGYLREHHHRHHVLTNALSPWWSPAKLDHNDPARFLEVPSMLHLRGLHASWKKLNAKGAQHSTTIWKKKLNDLWNVTWVQWLEARLATWGITPATIAGYRAAVAADPKLRDRVSKAIDGPGTRHVMRVVGGLVGVPRLARYYVKEKGTAEATREQKKYQAQMASLRTQLAKVTNPDKRKRIIDKWQRGVVGRFSKKAKVIWERVR